MIKDDIIIANIKENMVHSCINEPFLYLHKIGNLANKQS